MHPQVARAEAIRELKSCKPHRHYSEDGMNRQVPRRGAEWRADGGRGARIREFFSYVAKIVNAKKIRKSSSFAVDRDVPAGAVVAGITQENRESVSQCRKASQSRASHYNSR